MIVSHESPFILSAAPTRATWADSLIIEQMRRFIVAALPNLDAIALSNLNFAFLQQKSYESRYLPYVPYAMLYNQYSVVTKIPVALKGFWNSSKFAITIFSHHFISICFRSLSYSFLSFQNKEVYQINFAKFCFWHWYLLSGYNHYHILPHTEGFHVKAGAFLPHHPDKLHLERKKYQNNWWKC